jgi:aspartyl-tRNA(Asn)/glutamyl-tRNA(Gln) amidotransferase subunit C
MTVDEKTVRKIAQLARIAVADSEVSKLKDELNGILQFVETLEGVDVSNVAPLTSVVPVELPRRDDVVSDGDIQSLVLANAPLKEDGYFLVPKVVE